MFSRMLCFGFARALSLARSLSLFLLSSLSFPLPPCSVTVHGLVAKGDREIVYSTLVGSGAVRDLEIAFQVCKHANRNLHRKRRDAFMRTHAHTSDRDFNKGNRARTLAPKGLRIETAAGLCWIGGFQTVAQKLWDGLCVPLRIAYVLNKLWSLFCKRYLPGAGDREREPEREAERESTGFPSST